MEPWTKSEFRTPLSQLYGILQFHRHDVALKSTKNWLLVLNATNERSQIKFKHNKTLKKQLILKSILSYPKITRRS